MVCHMRFYEEIMDRMIGLFTSIYNCHAMTVSVVLHLFRNADICGANVMSRTTRTEKE